MFQRIVERPLPFSPSTHPRWWAVANLLITLTGVLFLGWSLQPLVFLFWMEVVFAVGAALARVAGAMDGQPFLATLWRRIVLLGMGAALGVAFILLSVTFTFKAFAGGLNAGGFGGIRLQVWLLGLNYLAALLLHYFLNGRFRTANPMEELAGTFAHLLVLLALLMVLCTHLLPKFPEADHAFWAGLAVVGVKFLVDLAFHQVRKALGKP